MRVYALLVEAYSGIGLDISVLGVGMFFEEIEILPGFGLLPHFINNCRIFLIPQ